MNATATKQQNKATIAPAIPRTAFSMAETAESLGVSYQTVYRLNKRGLLRSSGGLRHKLFALCEIERYLRDTR